MIDFTRFLAISSFCIVVALLTACDLFKESPSTVVFKDITENAGISDRKGLGSSSAWIDYNNDGYLDLVFGIHGRRSKDQSVFFYKNDQGKKFTNITDELNIISKPIRTVSTGDYNNDDLPDIVFGTIKSLSRPVLSKNTGLDFEDVSESTNLTIDTPSTGHIIWADYNNDGFLDLFHVSARQSVLYKSNKDGTFFSSTEDAGLEKKIRAKSAAFFDYNNDGNLDIILATSDKNLLFKNNGDGTFSDVTDSAGIGGESSWRSVAVCPGDMDNDGFEDIYIVNISSPRNALYRNNGDGTFTDITEISGTTDVGDGRTCSWVDVNADGYLDLYASNHVNPSRLFLNMNGSGEFKDVAVESGLVKPTDVFSAAWGDYDNDGYIDVFLNGHAGIALAKNQGNDNRSVTVELVGDGILTNRSAIGSVAFLRTGNSTQMRRVSGGEGSCEQNMLPLYFGAGSNDLADLTVNWTSGNTCEFKDISINKNVRLKIEEINCVIDQL